MYTITAQGEAVLVEWMQSLRQRRRELEALEIAYDAIKPK
jgi:DNA-binding PadR family transcriptional regulator